MSGIKKFLVIQTAFIGDVILSTAVVEKLHRFFPEGRIDVLVRKGNENLLENNAAINHIHVWDKKNNKSKNLYRIIRQVRTEKYDFLINLHRFSSSGIVSLMSEAKYKIGFDKNPFAFCFNERKKHAIGSKGDRYFIHEVDRCLSLIESITDSSSELPKIYPSQSDVDLISPYCNEPFITISPASVWFTKQTPAKVWCDLIANSSRKCFLLGSPTDMDLCMTIKKMSPEGNIKILAGKLTLLQSAVLMSKAAMNFCNDSAPLHLCSAINAPVTVIYCSTIPEFGFGPLSKKSFVVQSQNQLNCKPCGLHGHRKCPKGHFKCGEIETRDLIIGMK